MGLTVLILTAMSASFTLGFAAAKFIYQKERNNE